VHELAGLVDRLIADEQHLGIGFEADLTLERFFDWLLFRETWGISRKTTGSGGFISSLGKGVCF